jgi:hypothetical protein
VTEPRDELDQAVTATRRLLETMLAWTPGPKAARTDLSSGFDHGPIAVGAARRSEPRMVSCLDCLANDDGRPPPGWRCETCGGRGVVPADGQRDPYERRAESFYGEERERRRDESRARDAAIARFERDERVRDGLEAPADLATRSLEQRDRQYAAGSYPELERCLAWLADAAPFRASQVWRFLIYQQDTVVSDRVREHLNETVVLLAGRMLLLCPRGVRVPPWLAEERDDGARKPSLWHGRGPVFDRARSERDALIVALAGDGHTAGEIARRYALSKRHVRRVLDRAADVPVASGPAA